MGCFSGSKDRGMQLEDEFDGPVKHRTCTDVTFLVLKIIFVIGLLGLVGYCMAYGDLMRLFNGYDNCGNVCGVVNAKAKTPACKGGDFKAKKYLKFDSLGPKLFDVKYTKRECVANCSAYAGYVRVFNKCFPRTTNESSKKIKFDRQMADYDYEESKVQPSTTVVIGDFFEEIATDMGKVWPYIIYTCLIAFGLSLFFLLMFRYAAPVMVWASLIIVVIVTTGSAIYLWLHFSKIDTSTKRGSEEKSNVMFGAIVATILAVVVVLVILVMRKRISLVIQLFEEAAKAAASMPLIFIQPIWTFLSLGVIFILWFYFAIYIQSAGKLTPVDVPAGDPASGFYYYKKDMAMKITRWYNIFAVFWVTQFVIGCQHMVIAGAVSTWYFTRDKSRLGFPIWTSLSILVRYHLGSVLLASLLMAIIAFIKFLMKLMERAAKQSNNGYLKLVYYCFMCIMNCVENIFNMISRNAYVEIAIYGQSFCTSAKRGLKVLFNNFFSAAAINSVGDFVLFIVKLLIIVITLMLSAAMLWKKEDINHLWLPFFLIFIFTMVIAHTFISVFEMIIDTLFICFCEDCEMNDGINKPYFMNRGLMEFVENSKKVLKIRNKEETEPSAPPAM